MTPLFFGSVGKLLGTTKLFDIQEESRRVHQSTLAESRNRRYVPRSKPLKKSLGTAI